MPYDTDGQLSLGAGELGWMPLCLMPYAYCLMPYDTDGQLGLGAGELGWGLRCRHQVLPYASALSLLPYALCL